MSIEIRELVIRSEVVERGTSAGTQAPAGEVSSVVLQRIKAEVLAACRDLLRNQQRNQQER